MMSKKISQNMKDNINNYASQIITIEDRVKAIRQNIGVYLGRTGNFGFRNMIREIGQNGFDEINKDESPATEMTIMYDERNKQVTVKDNGRGIPFGNMKRVFYDLNTGSNYKKELFCYSSGAHGQGAKVTNAICKEFHVDSYIFGKHKRIDFKEGHPVGDEYFVKDNCPADAQGTTITFIPSEEVLGPLSVTCQDVLDLIISLFPINKLGCKVNFKGITLDGKVIEDTFVNIDGLTTNLIIKTTTPIIAPISIVRDTGEQRVELSFTYDIDSMGGYDITTYANFCPTTGGTHLKGFIDGITKYFKNYMNKIYLANSKKKDFAVNNNDILTGLQGVIHTCSLHPIFSGQCKEELGNEEMAPFVRDTIVEELDNYFANNNADLQKLCKYFKDVAEVRLNAEKGKMKLAKSYNASAVTGLPRQYVKPRAKKGPFELIIVEGKSAKGPAVNGRDDNQALFPVRGKTPNPFTTTTKKILANEEIGGIFQIIGCGVGKSCDIEKSKFDKIIIATDADPDGNHIAVNLSSTFAIYTPQLVQAGMLYKVVPPLYSVKKGKEQIFFSTRIDYVEYMQEIFSKSNKLIVNGKKMKPKEISQMAYNNIDYTYELECMARNYALNPRFLESIIKYSHLDFKKMKKKLKSLYGHTVDIYNQDNFIHVVGLVDNVYQMLIITDRFKLESKYIKDKYLYDSSSEYVINNTKCLWLYDLMKMFDNNGTNMKVTRYKGLGELNAKDLRETTLLDNNRTLIQYTMESIKEDIKKLRSYDSDKKKLIKDSVATRSDLLG